MSDPHFHEEFGRTHARAWAEIDSHSLTHNIHTLRKRFCPSGPDRLLAVVKADAYGHGLSLVAPVCVAAGISHFGVATVEEGESLRAMVPEGTTILIIAPTLAADAARMVAAGLVPLIGDVDVARAIDRAAELHAGHRADVHIEVDTGMGRSGVAPKDLRVLLADLGRLRNVRVTGISTHFTRADEDIADAVAQEKLFSDLYAGLGEAGRAMTVHIHNSPASLVLTPDDRHDLIRCGLSLYGIEPVPGMFSSASVDLKPVMSLKARVMLCRELPEGAHVSYGRTYTVPPGGGVYATIGLGYGDGYPRSLSSKGSVILHGVRAPICGRICMDQFVADVSAIRDTKVGDVATLVGKDGGVSLRAADIAALIDATPHEITTCLSPRVPRVVV